MCVAVPIPLLYMFVYTIVSIVGFGLGCGLLLFTGWVTLVSCLELVCISLVYLFLEAI